MNILNQKIIESRLHIGEIIKDLHQMTIDIGNEELADTVSDLRNRIHEPFMFVIVGEVKAGKSSFINALLETDKEVCKVAPDPCTDTIQQILYGEEESTIVVNEHLKKILLPVEILKEIAIVDTPGTNTISDHHQEITERFIPGSDLIVFVFEAKNPYRQSAWEFFDYIHGDWRKKIIFILQQKDLMNNSDLATNIEGVRKQAVKKGIEQPNVFAVSAKMEIEKTPNSGFLPVRQYIAQNITGGKAPILKLTNNISTSRNVGERIHKGLQLRSAQLEADQRFREDIRETLDGQEVRSNNQIDILVENLIAAYDRITSETREELKNGLGFFSLVRRTFSSMFGKKSSLEQWLADLSTNMERDLNDAMHEKVQSGVTDIADSIQQMAKMIDLKIRNSKTILKNNHEIFGDIADRRSNVMRDLQEEFSKFMNKTENFIGSEVFKSENNTAPNLAAGGGLAVVGVILATVAQGMVFDITGGILTTVGFLFAGATARMRRNKVIEDYTAEVNGGRLKLESEVSDKLKAYVGNIKEKIDANFDDFDVMLDMEVKQITNLNEKYEQIDSSLTEMQRELEEAIG